MQILDKVIRVWLAFDSLTISCGDDVQLVSRVLIRLTRQRCRIVIILVLNMLKASVSENRVNNNCCCRATRASVLSS